MMTGMSLEQGCMCLAALGELFLQQWVTLPRAISLKLMQAEVPSESLFAAPKYVLSHLDTAQVRIAVMPAGHRGRQEAAVHYLCWLSCCLWGRRIGFRCSSRLICSRLLEGFGLGLDLLGQVIGLLLNALSQHKPVARGRCQRMISAVHKARLESSQPVGNLMSTC